MYLSVSNGIVGAWLFIGVVWMVGALTSKQTTRQQTPGSRLFHISALVLTALLFFSSSLRFWPLSMRVVPTSAAFGYVGLALTIAGVLFATWARLSIGRNWSAAITIKADHQLITSGPYAVARHPIYSGFLLAILGTAIAVGELRCFIALLITSAAWHIKAEQEERFMVEQFGADYGNYQGRVKALIPFVL